MREDGIRICSECLRPLGDSAQWEGLRIDSFPPRAYWQGLAVERISPMQVRLLLELAQTGAASHWRLLMMLGEETSGKALDVHIYQINRAFREQAVPVQVRAKRHVRWLEMVQEAEEIS